METKKSSKTLLFFLIVNLIVQVISTIVSTCLRWFSSLITKPQTNLFLSENFAPVFDELEAEELPLKSGKLPSDLNGIYVRNGPNHNLHPKETTIGLTVMV